jgi:hypothetical protein
MTHCVAYNGTVIAVVASVMDERIKHQIKTRSVLTWGVRVFLSVGAWIFVQGLGTTSCTSDGGYACGEATAGNADEVRKCDGPDQVCICATHSCAQRTFDVVDASTDSGTGGSTTTDEDLCPDGQPRYGKEPCPSNLRYLDPPFIDEQWAGCCVSQAHADNVIERGAKDPRCPGVNDTESGESSSGSGGAGGGNGAASGGNGTQGDAGT